MDDRETLIDYKGEITYGIISELLRQLKHKTDQLNMPMSIYKRLLSITDESLENISMYFDKLKNSYNTFKEYPSRYTLSSTNSSYWITAQNQITFEDKLVLQEKIERINSFSEFEIKEGYKETIANGRITKEGGAGLGLLIIAKSSGNKINYTFEQLNEEFLYFSITIEIKNEIHGYITD
jgi:hypothetical protein